MKKDDGRNVPFEIIIVLIVGADRMDTVAIGKRYFKHCMKDQKQ